MSGGKFVPVPRMETTIKANSAGKKRGRRKKPYQASNGNYVNGLRRHKDGRWILEDGRSFTEPDEGKAIRKALSMMSRDDYEPIAIFERSKDIEVDKQTMVKVFNKPNSVVMTEAEMFRWFGDPDCRFYQSCLRARAELLNVYSNSNGLADKK